MLSTELIPSYIVLYLFILVNIWVERIQRQGLRLISWHSLPLNFYLLLKFFFEIVYLILGRHCYNLDIRVFKLIFGVLIPQLWWTRSEFLLDTILAVQDPWRCEFTSFHSTIFLFVFASLLSICLIGIGYAMTTFDHISLFIIKLCFHWSDCWDVLSPCLMAILLKAISSLILRGIDVIFSMIKYCLINHSLFWIVHISNFAFMVTLMDEVIYLVCCLVHLRDKVWQVLIILVLEWLVNTSLFAHEFEVLAVVWKVCIFERALIHHGNIYWLTCFHISLPSLIWEIITLQDFLDKATLTQVFSWFCFRWRKMSSINQRHDIFNCIYVLDCKHFTLVSLYVL